MKFNKSDNKFSLEEQLINLAVFIIEIFKSMPKTRAGNLLAGQLIRPGTSFDLNYIEAPQFVRRESKKNFIHKIKIVLKEFLYLKNFEKHLYVTNHL